MSILRHGLPRMPIGEAKAILTEDERRLADGSTMLCWARISPDEKFRYELGRCWSLAADLCLFIMLNPSTADALDDDHTVRKCMGFAIRWGYGGFIIGNLYPFRTKSPKVLEQAWLDGVDIRGGDEGDAWLRRMFQFTRTVVFAWGASLPKAGMEKRSAGLTRTAYVAELADPMHNIMVNPPTMRMCLGKTKDGHPKHPLTLGYDTPLVPFR